MAGSANGQQQLPLGQATQQFSPHQQQDNIFQTSADQMRRAQGTNIGGGSGIAGQSGGTPQVQAQQLSGMDLSGYMNPFQQQVTDATISDNERARQMAMMQQGAQASQSGAFGGSRHGVAEGVTMGEFDRNNLNALAGMNFENFANAQQMGQFDIGTDLQAQTSNQGAALQEQQNRIAQAQARAAQTQASARAALARAQISNLGFNQGMQLNEAMMNAGGMQQGLQQQLIDQGSQQYGGWSGSPQQSLAAVGSALGSTPSVGSTTESRQPGLFDYLTLGLSI